MTGETRRQWGMLILLAAILAGFLFSVSSHVQSLHPKLNAFNDNPLHNLALRLARWQPGFPTLFLLSLSGLLLYLSFHALLLLPAIGNPESAFRLALRQHYPLVLLLLHPLLAHWQINSFGRRLALLLFALGLLLTLGRLTRALGQKYGPRLRRFWQELWNEWPEDRAALASALRNWRAAASSLSPLLLLTAFALLLRLYRMDERGIWWDEFAAFNWNKGSIGELLRLILQYDSHPPLFYLVERFFFQQFGFSIWVSRLPMALCSAAVVPLVYATGRRLSGPGVAWMACILAAVNPFAIVYAHEARMYPLLYLLLSLVLLALVHFRQRPGPLAFFAYAILLSLALLTHYMALPFAAAALLIVAFQAPRLQLSRLAGASLLAMIPLLLWGLLSHSSPLSGDFSQRLTHWLESPGLKELLRTPALLFDGPFNPQGMAALGWLTGLLLLPFACFWWTKRQENGQNLLVAWLLLPPLLAFVLSLLLESLTGAAIYQVKHMIGCLPALYLLFALRIASLPLPGLRQAAFLSLLLLQSGSLLQYYQHDLSTSWPEAGRHLMTICQPGEPVLVLPDLALASLETYTRGNPAIRPLSFRPHLAGDRDEQLETFTLQHFSHADTVHVVLREIGVRYGETLPHDGRLLKRLQQGRYLRRVSSFPGGPDIHILSYCRTPPPAEPLPPLHFQAQTERLYLLRYFQETGILPDLRFLAMHDGGGQKFALQAVAGPSGHWEIDLPPRPSAEGGESVHLLIDPVWKSAILSHYAYIGQSKVLRRIPADGNPPLVFQPTTFQDPFFHLLSDLALALLFLLLPLPLFVARPSGRDAA